MSGKNIIEINQNNFVKEVEKSEKPVLVDFWANWCGPCRMLSPIIEQLADELAGTAKVAKVNVDSESNIASKFGIMSIPTVILFKNGKPVETIVGVRPKDFYNNMIKKYIDN